MISLRNKDEWKGNYIFYSSFYLNINKKNIIHILYENKSLQKGFHNSEKEKLLICLKKYV
jgi:hypothetical protein